MKKAQIKGKKINWPVGKIAFTNPDGVVFTGILEASNIPFRAGSVQPISRETIIGADDCVEVTLEVKPQGARKARDHALIRKAVQRTFDKQHPGFVVCEINDRPDGGLDVTARKYEPLPRM